MLHAHHLSVGVDVVDELQLVSDRKRCPRVIAGDHPHCDACLLAGLDRARYLWSRGVHNRSDAAEDQLLMMKANEKNGKSAQQVIGMIEREDKYNDPVQVTGTYKGQNNCECETQRDAFYAPFLRRQGWAAGHPPPL